jgi:hypothetical protein
MLSKSSIALSLAASVSLAAAGPCDIYASGGTPCVAAHGTTRALYNAYNGPLYQVKRGSDGKTTDIFPLSAGGVANAATQDSFCAKTTCLISVIYDQSGSANHLYQAPKGAFSGPEADGSDNLASAIGAPVTLNGKKAYGVFIPPGTGYRNDKTSGVATGNAAESMYAVLDATHYNDACCFDYGNAEVGNTDTGNGHMEAIYLGSCTIWGTGAGDGPWFMADLENGLFSGENPKQNIADPSLFYRFTTAALKGNGGSKWSLRGGNAASGSLSTFYSGPRPAASGYNPMSLEGAILLGIGGDNSNGAQGTFYEGCMTTGYASDATEASVQANIVAAKYATTSLNSAPLTVGSKISLKLTTPGYDTRYIAHTGATVNTQVVTSSSPTSLKKQASWTVRTGLGNSDCYSFESVDTPGSYIRHYNFVLQLNANANTKSFKEDATFCSQTGLSGTGNTIRSWSYPAKFMRHYNNVGYIASEGGVHDFDNASGFNNDVSFVVGASFA